MTETVLEKEVKNSLRQIVAHSDAKALNYAVNYAKAGLSMSGDELRVQCLYVLNNMSRWRGDVAKSVRKTLKDFTKTK